MITKDERKVIDKFIKSVTDIEDKLNLAFPIAHNPFKEVKERAKYVELFMEFRKCMKESNHRYSDVITILEKLDTENKYSDEFLKVEGIVEEAKNRSDAMVLYFPHSDERNLTNWQAFQELESKYFTHSDGLRSPIKHIEANPDDEVKYITQVVFMMNNLGMGVFGPLCFIAKELLSEAN